jgi:hypothetical protein
VIKSSARVISAQWQSTESGSEFQSNSGVRPRAYPAIILRALHFNPTATNASFPRATTQTLAPRCAYRFASARPTPLDAPKIKTRSTFGGTISVRVRRDRRLEILLNTTQAAGMEAARAMAAVTPME